MPILPLDVVSIIFEFLTTKNMLKASLCCKAWRSVLWRYKKYTINLCRYDYLNQPFKLFNLSYISWANKIILPSDFPKNGLIYLRHCEEVSLHDATNIDLRNLCAKYTDKEGKFKHIKSKSNIRKLTILSYGESENKFTGSGMKYLHSIEYLYLTGGFPNLKAEDFIFLKNLKYFSYTNFRKDRCLSSTIFEYLPNIEEITLSGDIDGHGLKYLKKCKRATLSIKLKDGDLDTLTNLEYIKIECYKSQLTDAGFWHLKNLKYVELNSLTNLTDECLFLFQNCNVVDLNNFPLITNEGLKYLRYAQKVTISHCQNITDEGLKYLNNVKHVVIYHNINITDKGISYLENVQHISLNGCTQLTPICLNYLEKCSSIYFWLCERVYPALKNFKRKFPYIDITVRKS